MYFSCPTSLINTVFLSLIHIVKDILFILQMSYFIKCLGGFQLGANIHEIYYDHLMHFSHLCGGEQLTFFFYLKIYYCCMCVCLMSTYVLTCHGVCVENGEQLHQVIYLLLPLCGLWGWSSVARLAWEAFS